jgi:hypothetical protein
MNDNRRRVILCGNSLILAGVRTGLEKCPDLEICILDHPFDHPLEKLDPHCPAALIFDLSVVQGDLLLLLFQQPGLLLIGLNPETHEALVWSGRHAAAIVGADLIQVIMEGEGPGACAPGMR